MTTIFEIETKGRVQAGRLAVQPAPIEGALVALQQAVPPLEAQLGFALNVTAQSRPQGSIAAAVIMPDAHYSFAPAMTISTVLQRAVQPFGIDLDVEVDSDLQNGQ